ncbi:hypothetical protein [Rhizobium leguminosarum]|uniref:hypothetical protein n=1 Tax=Rhizobium leguminosarum TaxID=384 RepID=UPI0013AEC790|nr:hypothetical protein [Rhizobium leguminosarum]
MNEAFLHTLTGQIVVGLASGILSSLSIWMFVRFSNDTLLPWLQRRFYKGLLVNGTWIGERPDRGRTYGFILDIVQDGYNLRGTFVANNTHEDGKKTSKTYAIRGNIYNNYIILTYEPVSSRSYGSGTFVFQLYTAGRVLKGGMLYMRTTSGEIQAVDDLELSREES